MSIFDKFSNKCKYTETGSNKRFIYGRYGRITEMDDPEIFDVWVVGPYCNAVGTKKLRAILRALEPYLLNLRVLDGEATADVEAANLEVVAKELGIQRLGKPRGIPLKKGS